VEPPARVVVRRTTGSARETFRLGQALGRRLAPGDVVALVGDLGAGKTQLVRGACQGAGVPAGEVSSPTFAIVATHRGRLPVHHADLYRVADLDELYATGFLDLVGGDGAVLVEGPTGSPRRGGWRSWGRGSATPRWPAPSPPPGGARRTAGDPGP
jgi:tRNA threonylcarbamoyl adenosine modification protein YjeE